MNTSHAPNTSNLLDENLLLAASLPARERAKARSLSQPESGPKDQVASELLGTLEKVLASEGLRKLLQSIDGQEIVLDTKREFEGTATLKLRISKKEDPGKTEICHDYWDWNTTTAASVDINSARFLMDRWDLTSVKLISKIHAVASRLHSQRHA